MPAREEHKLCQLSALRRIVNNLVNNWQQYRLAMTLDAVFVNNIRVLVINHLRRDAQNRLSLYSENVSG